ncbi:hypothetical protein HOY82DRAFT_562204 [Tuber indicum]|nr:hypothetical protein HOY82DRAFT_562204 [Tuber indicum]
MLYNSALLLTLISTVTSLPPASDPSENVNRSSGILGATTVNAGSLIPAIGTVVSDRMRDRKNCAVRPDLGFGGFFNSLDSYPLLIGDGKVLNGTQGQELVTKGCKTMIPEGPKKFTKKPGENGVSTSICIKSAPEQDRSRSSNSLEAPWKHVTNGLKYKVYITHPIRGNVGDVEASREDCEKRLNQVLTECAFLGAGGYVLEKKDNKEHLYYGLSVSECDGDLPIV